MGEVGGSPELARTTATLTALIAWDRGFSRARLRPPFQVFL